MNRSSVTCDCSLGYWERFSIANGKLLSWEPRFMQPGWMNPAEKLFSRENLLCYQRLMPAAILAQNVRPFEDFLILPRIGA